MTSDETDFLDFVAANREPPKIEPVLFGGKEDDPRFKCFSNFTPFSFLLDGETWPTVEHYFVSQKDPSNQEFQRAVRSTLSPGAVKRLGYTITLREGWDDLKYEVMKKAVFAKFSQHQRLRDLLLSTGDRPIHENRKDPWWGGGPHYKGCHDWLGQILMEVRELLRASGG
jgi:ribA/ribD-fused uncharacterized protein